MQQDDLPVIVNLIEYGTLQPVNGDRFAIVLNSCLVVIVGPGHIFICLCIKQADTIYATKVPNVIAGLDEFCGERVNIPDTAIFQQHKIAGAIGLYFVDIQFGKAFKKTVQHLVNFLFIGGVFLGRSGLSGEEYSKKKNVKFIHQRILVINALGLTGLRIQI